MSTTHTIPQSKVRRIVANLTALGDKLEADGNPLWIEAATAAAALECLRLGVAVVEPFSNQSGGLTS